MGQFTSTSSARNPSSISDRRLRNLASGKVVQTPMARTDSLIADLPPRDFTAHLPDDCLAIVFQSLSPADQKRCSLVCRRWFAVEGQSRHRLALDAQAGLLDAVPSILSRYDGITKLALKCDRRAGSVGDEALALIAARCPKLSRLKLRACRAVTDSGMAAVAKHCPELRKLSIGSCSFGFKGIEAVLRGCTLLEDLSVKRLRGLRDAFTASELGVGAPSLRSVCLKELVNAQCFSSLIAGSPNLKSLKLFRCSGDWDMLLEELADKVPGIVEIHLEKVQVSDRGLMALAYCVNLEILHLVKTPECTDAGLAAIAEGCHLLRKIHIDGWKTNRIGDEGLMAIARRCLNLQELVLVGLNPTARSLDLIASNCSNLERLALCGSETFGDAEITCIASKCMALKKLCIKGCPVSDLGLEALAEGCPKLVKVKVKKCRGVTAEFAEWLIASRDGMLAVNVDATALSEQPEPSVDESGILENGDEQLFVSVEPIRPADAPSSSHARTSPWKTRMGFLTGRSFVASAFRRWSHGNSQL